MAALELTLFGGLKVSAGGKAIPVIGRKERALLAYLAMPAGKPRLRDGICGLLWGERSERQAHDSLKEALHRLRSSLGPGHSRAIAADRSFITLDPHAVTVDVGIYEQLLVRGNLDATLCAIELYRGDLLEEMDARDHAFEDWLALERNRLRNLQIEALVSLLDRVQSGDPRCSPDMIVPRLLALDPLQEGAHRALMGHYAEQGQTALALKQYSLCRDALQKELGINPEPGTERLYRSIRTERAARSRTAPIRTSPPLYRASIEVLPFVNLSGRPCCDDLAAGITEDIATDLARWRTLDVSSVASARRWTDDSADWSPAGRGLRLMAKGSIRRVDGHMRIATQLIDAESGRLVWAERFDRSEEDLPSAQDDIVRAIVGIMAGRIQVMETERAREKPPTALAASDLTLAGNALSWDDPVSACAAKRSFERAIEMDPGFARPYSLLAVMIGREWRNDPASSRGPLDLALNLAERAVELAGDESTCCTSLGYICLERHEFDLALHHMKRGVELNPVNPWNQVDLGYLLSYIGRAEEAQKTLEKARRLDPYIGAPWYWRSLGVANFVLREYRDALAAFERAGARSPLYAVAMMAACCRKVGLADRARALLAGQSETTIVDVLAKIPFKNASDATHLDECLGLTGTAGSR